MFTFEVSSAIDKKEKGNIETPKENIKEMHSKY